MVVDHDIGRIVGGIIAEAVNPQTGRWVALKLGHTGRELVQGGHHAVSGEFDAAGKLEGVALCVQGRPAFSTARVLVPDEVEVESATVGVTSSSTSGSDPHPAPVFASAAGLVVDEGGRLRQEQETSDPHASGLREVAREADIHGGRLVWAPPMPPVLGAGLTGPSPVVDVAEERRESYASSITRIEEDAEYDRARYRERQAALAYDELAHEEQLLRQSMTPIPLWPHRQPAWQSWRAFEDQLEAGHREDERLRVLAKERLIREQVDAWVWRHPVDEPITEQETSWLRRLLRRQYSTPPTASRS